jgi:acetyl-CoA synthetase
MKPESASRLFIEARDRLLALGGQPARARADFVWPRLRTFNWVRDFFDVISSDNERPALRIVDDAGLDQTLSFAALSRRSSQVAAFLSGLGLGRGDRILIMLGNVVPLWEMVLAAIKLGAVIVPATTLLQSEDLQDRLARGGVKAIVTHSELVDRFSGCAGSPVRISVGARREGWTGYALSAGSAAPLGPVEPSLADDLLLLYFTSGTTRRPKLVAHTHASYPIGHLTTMYWLGLRRGDVHLNLSSPGWAKHAWSSLFAPWNAEATVLAYQYERFDPKALLDQMVRCQVTTFCAPPTVWRMLIQLDLRRWRTRVREAASAGEPLNPEVIQRVRDAWGITIRDGFGQTETSAQIGNCPGEEVKPGSMGRPLPGCPVVLLDHDGRPAEEGEICIDLDRSPVGLMKGYWDDPECTAAVMNGGFYHTGDVAARDADGCFTYVGRMDDVFKSSDYRISPFELESILIEHPAVVETAVVPSPDPLRLHVPKAFVTLKAGEEPNAAIAQSIFAHIRARVSPYKRIRRLEFGPLPKTISGKIRRSELRKLEEARPTGLEERRPLEFWEADFGMDGRPRTT